MPPSDRIPTEPHTSDRIPTEPHTSDRPEEDVPPSTSNVSSSESDSGEAPALPRWERPAPFLEEADSDYSDSGISCKSNDSKVDIIDFRGGNSDYDFESDHQDLELRGDRGSRRRRCQRSEHRPRSIPSPPSSRRPTCRDSVRSSDSGISLKSDGSKEIILNFKGKKSTLRKMSESTDRIPTMPPSDRSEEDEADHEALSPPRKKSKK